MEASACRGSRPSIVVCPKRLEVAGLNCRLVLAVILLAISTCHIRGETIPPDLDLVYQRNHPEAVILGLPDEESGGSAVKRLSSFMPMRGRRGPDGSSVYSETGEDKRAMSFLPSRGKKDQDAEPKRASSFMAMRGRRMDGHQEPMEGHFYDVEDEEDKRSSFMPMRGRKSAFMPMRGRKWSPDSEALYFPSSEEKRSSFMPMRGRKKAYYGSKSGKKRLNSFMPMRGKKDSAEDDEGQVITSQNNMNRVEDEIVERALEEAINSNNNNVHSEASLTGEDKRGSAFFGMRGKRHAMIAARAGHKQPSPGTVKREALFFAARGKRSPDTQRDNGQQSQGAGDRDDKHGQVQQPARN